MSSSIHPPTTGTGRRISLRNTKQESPTRWQDLPEECWELVFDRLLLKYHQDYDQDHHHRRYHQHLESVSLVCKHFLSISNRIRSTLNIIDPLITPSNFFLNGFQNTLSVLLQRFRHLNRINLDEFHGGDLDLILTQLSKSGLKNLQALNISNQKKFPEKGLKELGSKMKNSLKILICARLEDLTNQHLVVIGDSLPYLEELDISFPPKQDDFRHYPSSSRLLHINDEGIVNLSSKLPNLRKINISGIHDIFLFSSLLAISSNCVFLTHFTADNYIFLCEGDIPSIIYNSRYLISLILNGDLSPPPDTIESSLVSSRDLRVLDFSYMVISDEFLFSVRKAGFSLMKLSLFNCRGFTIDGIDSILCGGGGYGSLKHLDLQGADFLTDQSVFDLSKYMHGLNFIGLNSCSRLTSSTFFTLARNCLSLQEIRMGSTSLGKDGFPTEFLGKNLAIRVLKFPRNTHLNDKTLEKIGFVCPKLESLDVSRCLGITEHGIHEVGKRCSEVREIKMVGCKRICDFLVTHNSSEFSKLEVLDAMSSGISDGGLSRVGCNCIGLQRLVLECCFGVTKEGVIEVVNKCKRLRELNLKNCSMTIVASLSLIVFSRPSLRKIIPPGGFIPGKKQKDLFLRHGCMVCDG